MKTPQSKLPPDLVLPRSQALLKVLAGARRVGSLGVNNQYCTAVWEKAGRLFTVRVTPKGDIQVQYVLDIIGGKEQLIGPIHTP